MGGFLYDYERHPIEKFAFQRTLQNALKLHI
jgi:hypothetical protein